MTYRQFRDAEKNNSWYWSSGDSPPISTYTIAISSSISCIRGMIFYLQQKLTLKFVWTCVGFWYVGEHLYGSRCGMKTRCGWHADAYMVVNNANPLVPPRLTGWEGEGHSSWSWIWLFHWRVAVVVVDVCIVVMGNRYYLVAAIVLLLCGVATFASLTPTAGEWGGKLTYSTKHPHQSIKTPISRAHLQNHSPYTAIVVISASKDQQPP